MPNTAAASTELSTDEAGEVALATETESVEAVSEEIGDSEAYPDDPINLEILAEQTDESTDEDELEEENADEDDERTDKELAGEMLALIFASPDPLSTGRLGKLLGLKGKKKVQGGLDALALQLADQGLPLVLRSVAGGWRLFTRPEMGELLSGLTERKPDRISPAALETLAIIAYRQPVSKAEIEAIRGVGSGPILRALVDRRLAKVTGRADQPGSPLLYGTTREFLERFGLDSPADLPRDGELARE